MTTATCVHRWSIEMPQGEYSQGVCRNCGEQREFRNWEPDVGSMYSKQNGGKNRLTPGQAAFGHQSITKSKPVSVPGKNVRVRS